MRPPSLFMVALLLTTAMPVTATDDTAEANRAFAADRLAALGADVESPAVKKAIERFAARAGDVRLVTSGGDLLPTEVVVGDIWVIEFDVGSCPKPRILAPGVPPQQPNPSLYIYEGDIGTARSTGSGHYVSWTFKVIGTYAEGVTINGQSNFWCEETGDHYIFFPYLTGTMYTNLE